jgi:hypothetical protein
VKHYVNMPKARFLGKVDRLARLHQGTEPAPSVSGYGVGEKRGKRSGVTQR